uniref:transmembrane protein 154 isoform X1 n=1 Tax=Gasterosteus aculeatus aculeatus TaxID=481459 RepID=UPI0000E3BEDB|nr:transmembrane protein 154 isoform X1 [Gasterosteus aculeatus aculeatus]
MFACGTGNMRGPRMKTPLLLLLLLLTTLTGTAAPQSVPNATVEPDYNLEEPHENTNAEDTGLGSLASVNESLEPTEGLNVTGRAAVPGKEEEEEEEEENKEDEEGLSPIIILIPVVLAVIIISTVCGIFISRRWNQKGRSQELRKEDPYLDGSSTEKVPMPMFEEDVPSVLELDMEELDQWMKKDCDPSDDSKLA